MPTKLLRALPQPGILRCGIIVRGGDIVGDIIGAIVVGFDDNGHVHSDDDKVEIEGEIRRVRAGGGERGEEANEVRIGEI